MGDVLILVEHADGEVKRYSRELACKARDLAAGRVDAVVFGDTSRSAIGKMGGLGVSRAFVARHKDMTFYSPEAYAKALADVVGKARPKYILATATSLGNDLLARTAMRFKAGMVSDCVDLKLDGENLVARRSIYGGNAIATVWLRGMPQFATLRPNLFPVEGATDEIAEVVPVDVEPSGIRARVVNRVRAESEMVDLAEADYIVSGGRAMKGAEGFAILKGLADAIGAGVGASRAAVDSGFISHDHQVGQTGKTVNPKLYIACGISGAIQHLAGMRNSKVVVAINRDPEAPIFTKADYGIVGDLFEIVPALTSSFEKLLKN